MLKQENLASSVILYSLRAYETKNIQNIQNIQSSTRMSKTALNYAKGYNGTPEKPRSAMKRPVLRLHGIPPVAIRGPLHSHRWIIRGPPVVHPYPPPPFGMAIDGNENIKKRPLCLKSCVPRSRCIHRLPMGTRSTCRKVCGKTNQCIAKM